MRQKVLCIIQDRMGSPRLPGKVLKEVRGMSLLEYQIRRMKQAKLIDRLVVATTINAEDNQLEQFCAKAGVDCFRGSEEDVLERYRECAQQYPEYRIIVRATGDCPLIDPVVVDEVIQFLLDGDYNYVSNVAPPTFPDGMDIEAFTRESLEKAAREAKRQSEREHVTLYIRESGKFRTGNVSAEKDYSQYRLTVDDPEDFEVVSLLIQNLPPDASFQDYVKYLDAHPEIKLKNTHIVRNEGLAKSLKNEQI